MLGRWMVAHALSYSNLGELRVRVAALAEAAGWTSEVCFANES
jgi:hypothetical protein